MWPADPVKVKGLIGVVPDDSNLYPELTCRRNLEYMGELYGLPRRERGRRVAGLLETFGLADRAGMPFRALSRGLKRRLVLAAALVHSPQVLFLDEPTIGLDVPSARNLRQVIRRVNREGGHGFPDHPQPGRGRGAGPNRVHPGAGDGWWPSDRRKISATGWSGGCSWSWAWPGR